MKIVLLIILNIAFLLAQENYIGFLHGKDHVYSLQAPKGWILDNQSGVNQGLHAVFYKVGGSWGKSPVVMYTNVLIKKYEEIKNADEFLKKYLPDYISRFEGNKVEKVEPYITADSDTLQVYHYFDNQYKNYEYVCYIDEEKTVVLIVFVAKTEELVKENIKYFYELIDSYKFLTDDQEKFLEVYNKFQNSNKNK